MMRLADSGTDVDDGDLVELLSTVGWLLVLAEPTLCRIESIKALALVARSFLFPKNMVLHMNNTQLL